MAYKTWQLVFSYRYADEQRQAFVWRRRARRSGSTRWYTETATIDGWKGVDEADHEVHAAWMQVDAKRNRRVRNAKRMGTYGSWR